MKEQLKICRSSEELIEELMPGTLETLTEDQLEAIKCDLTDDICCTLEGGKVTVSDGLPGGINTVESLKDYIAKTMKFAIKNYCKNTLYIVEETAPGDDIWDIAAFTSLEQARKEAEWSWDRKTRSSQQKSKQWIEGYNGYSSLKEFYAAIQDMVEMPESDFYEELH